MAAKAISNLILHPHHRTHLVFGANTDVGKSIISTGLVRAAAAAASIERSVNYIKPLQCGGSDESFVVRHDNKSQPKIHCKTLFSWNTPASPHLASRWENMPISDEQVMGSLAESLETIKNSTAKSSTIIETAGGALSPSSSSPLNPSTIGTKWGWSTQADLYKPLKLPVVFVGDGKLGGISVTLSTLEALWNRGYSVDAVVFINNGSETESNTDGTIRFGEGNAEALKEYTRMISTTKFSPCESIQCIEKDAIVLLPPLPPMPEPLDTWYQQTSETFSNLNQLLNKKWETYFK